MRRRVLRWMTFALAAAALGLGAALPSASAQSAAAPSKGEAPRPVTADILEMHATLTDGGSYIDPLIGNMPQLTKPPFSAYNSYKLLDHKTLAMLAGSPQTFRLVNARLLQLTLIEVTGDKRYHVATAINQPGGTAFLKLLEVKAAANETFFVGGQSYKGGSLVLAITMRP